MTKYYNCIIVLESFEFKIGFVLIPESVNNNQLDAFKRHFFDDFYDGFNYMKKMCIDGQFVSPSFKGDSVEKLYNVLKSKCNERTR